MTNLLTGLRKVWKPKRVMALVFILACLLIGGKLLLILSYRSSPSLAAMAFWSALHDNDTFMAKRITATQHHPFIDKWMDEHTRVQCESEFGNGPTGVGFLDNSGKWVTSISGVCDTLEGISYSPYCFSIRNIIVERDRFGWHVVAWGEIIEDCER